MTRVDPRESGSSGALTLVAGGAGILGSAVARRLAGEGRTVLVADSLGGAGGLREARESRALYLGKLRNVTVHRIDLSSPMRLASLFHRYRPRTVVNAAIFDPRGAGLRPLVEACASSGVELFVHLSDAALAGGEEDLSTPLGGRRAEESLLAASSLPFAILRVPLLEAADREEGGPGRTLSADEVGLSVCEALRRGPSRKIALLVSDAGAVDDPVEGETGPTGTEARARAMEKGRQEVSRRELFGLFRGTFGHAGPAA